MKYEESTSISDEAWPVLAIESVMLTIDKLKYKNHVEYTKKTLGEYREKNPKGFEIWRQLYLEGLTAAMLQLAENLPEHVKSEISSCCSTEILREACRTGS